MCIGILNPYGCNSPQLAAIKWAVAMEIVDIRATPIDTPSACSGVVHLVLLESETISVDVSFPQPHTKTVASSIVVTDVFFSQMTPLFKRNIY